MVPLVIIHEQKPPSYWGTTVLGTEWPLRTERIVVDYRPAEQLPAPLDGRGR